MLAGVVGEGRIGSLGWDLGSSAEEGRAGERDSPGWEDSRIVVAEEGSPEADILVAGMGLGCEREAAAVDIPGLDMVELVAGKGSQVDFLLLLAEADRAAAVAVDVRAERGGIDREVVAHHMNTVAGTWSSQFKAVRDGDSEVLAPQGNPERRTNCA